MTEPKEVIEKTEDHSTHIDWGGVSDVKNLTATGNITEDNSTDVDTLNGDLKQGTDNTTTVHGNVGGGVHTGNVGGDTTVTNLMAQLEPFLTSPEADAEYLKQAEQIGDPNIDAADKVPAVHADMMGAAAALSDEIAAAETGKPDVTPQTVAEKIDAMVTVSPPTGNRVLEFLRSAAEGLKPVASKLLKAGMVAYFESLAS